MKNLFKKAGAGLLALLIIGSPIVFSYGAIVKANPSGVEVSEFKINDEVSFHYAWWKYDEEKCQISIAIDSCFLNEERFEGLKVLVNNINEECPGSCSLTFPVYDEPIMLLQANGLLICVGNFLEMISDNFKKAIDEDPEFKLLIETPRCPFLLAASSSSEPTVPVASSSDAAPEVDETLPFSNVSDDDFIKYLESQRPTGI